MDLIGLYSNPTGVLLPEINLETVENSDSIVQPRRSRQRQTRLTDTEICDLVQKRRAGATIAQLAESFDVHRTTVMAHLRRSE